MDRREMSELLEEVRLVHYICSRSALLYNEGSRLMVF